MSDASLPTIPVRGGAAVPLLLVGVATLAGCGLPGFGGGGRPVAPPDRAGYENGLALLARGDFQAAAGALRVVVGECRRDEGPAALLLLASLHQDPRNVEAHPDTAALMAARYLAAAGGTVEGRRLAEGLYVGALDRGADPGLRPAPGWPGGACAPEEGAEPLALPVLTRNPESVERGRLLAGLDSLVEANTALQSRLAARDGELAAMEAELAAMEEELERIRRLLQEPDTASGGPPPGS